MKGKWKSTSRLFALAAILLVVRNLEICAAFQNARVTLLGLDQLHRRSVITAALDDDKESNIDVELDSDATPLFQEPPRTLFGLEPKAELDPLDNGLTFTGPLILLASIYITISVLMEALSYDASS